MKSSLKYVPFGLSVDFAPKIDLNTFPILSLLERKNPGTTFHNLLFGVKNGVHG